MRLRKKAVPLKIKADDFLEENNFELNKKYGQYWSEVCGKIWN